MNAKDGMDLLLITIFFAAVVGAVLDALREGDERREEQAHKCARRNYGRAD